MTNVPDLKDTFGEAKKEEGGSKKKCCGGESPKCKGCGKCGPRP